MIHGNGKKEGYPGVNKERLSIEVTTNCNGRCAHCFALADVSKPASLPLGLVKEIMAEGYEVAYRHLHITGGEPLLWEGLFEALDYAFHLGYETVFLNTNGLLLTEEVCASLAGYDDLSMSVSLEGSETLHGYLRGEGLYGQTVQGIKKALDAGIDLFIFTTACRSLLPGLPYFTNEIFSKFPEINHLILIQLIRVKDDLFDLSSELLDPDDFLRLVKMVALLNLYGHRSYVLNDPLIRVASKLLQMRWIPQAPPLYTAGKMIVKANRDIGLSHSSFDIFGKYEPGMIEKTLASDEYQVAVAPDEKTCNGCQYAELCRENGMERPSEWYADMLPEVPFCQRVLGRIAP